MYFELNFSYYGIRASDAKLDIISNYINYTTEALNIIETEITINGLIINTFEKDFYFYSSLNIENIEMNDGNLCIEMIDSQYTVDNYDSMNCIEAIMYEKYYFNVKIETNEGIEAPQQYFQFIDRELQPRTGYTGDSSYSSYYLMQVKKVDNSGLLTDFNPYYFTYSHNGISNTFEFSIVENSTLTAYLDATPLKQEYMVILHS